MKLGLGTGTTAEAFLDVLAPQLRGGMKIVGTATSERTAQKARAHCHPDRRSRQARAARPHHRWRRRSGPCAHLIKGGGGALLREKIVAASSKRMIVIADESKLVAKLGRFPLPVEVSTFGHVTTAARIVNAAAKLEIQSPAADIPAKDGAPFKTDGGNYIYDCAFGAIADAPALAAALSALPAWWTMDCLSVLRPRSSLRAKRRRGHREMSMKYDYDLFVIGGGSGGVRASRLAAQNGARVAIAEEYGFGGTCVIRGCIPKKLFVYASHYTEDFEDAAGYGWTCPRRISTGTCLSPTRTRKSRGWKGIYRANVDAAGVEIIHGPRRV